MFFTDHTGLHFCYDDSVCSERIIGVKTSPEGCCLPSGSAHGGLGAGSYAVDGDPQCVHCIGENDLSTIISTSVKSSIASHPSNIYDQGYFSMTCMHPRNLGRERARKNTAVSLE